MEPAIEEEPRRTSGMPSATNVLSAIRSLTGFFLVRSLSVRKWMRRDVKIAKFLRPTIARLLMLKPCSIFYCSFFQLPDFCLPQDCGCATPPTAGGCASIMRVKSALPIGRSIPLFAP